MFTLSSFVSSKIKTFKTVFVLLYNKEQSKDSEWIQSN